MGSIEAVLYLLVTATPCLNETCLIEALAIFCVSILFLFIH